MKNFLLTMVLGMVITHGCGSDVERTTGIISGSATWTGTWPQTDTILVVLFITPPWDPDYQAGAPATGRPLTQPETSTLAFEIDKPQMAFGTYGALLIAWQDPDDDNAATCYRPTSVYGTTIDSLNQAAAITLDAENPDAKGLVMETFELFESAEDMRSHYPPIQ